MRSIMAGANQYGPDTAALLREMAEQAGSDTLRIHDLNIHSLPPLPPNFRTVFLTGNQLTVLPPLPPTLRWLDCSDNQLTTLPVLPPTLQLLNCSNNQLTTSPAIPPNIISFNFQYNPITSVTLPFPRAIREYPMIRSFYGTRLQFKRYETLGEYETRMLAPKVETQLMGEQISRQTPLIPDVMKNVMEFANAKEPNRIVLDQAANRGVALPRLPPETEAETALRLELAKPDPNQAKIAALRREVARRGGRRTRRVRRSRLTKMKGTSRAKRR